MLLKILLTLAYIFIPLILIVGGFICLVEVIPNYLDKKRIPNKYSAIIIPASVIMYLSLMIVMSMVMS